MVPQGNLGRGLHRGTQLCGARSTDDCVVRHLLGFLPHPSGSTHTQLPEPRRGRMTPAGFSHVCRCATLARPNRLSCPAVYCREAATRLLRKTAHWLSATECGLVGVGRMFRMCWTAGSEVATMCRRLQPARQENGPSHSCRPVPRTRGNRAHHPAKEALPASWTRVPGRAWPWEGGAGSPAALSSTPAKPPLQGRAAQCRGLEVTGPHPR
jgi:hypothetical protein